MKRLPLFLIIFATSNLNANTNLNRETCCFESNNAHIRAIIKGVVSEQDADQANLSQRIEPLFVSLGSWCNVAGHLKVSGLRIAAFPFDWILTIDCEKFLEIFLTDFKYFLDDNYLSLKNGQIFNYYYNLQCPHEITNDDIVNKKTPEQLLETFKEKYRRRINRFRELENYKGKVYFMRSASINATHANIYFKCAETLTISDLYAERLFNALKERFPLLDFTLIIIDSGKPKKQLSKKLFRLQELPDLKAIHNL